MQKITLVEGIACKCSCRAHVGSDGKNYWVDSRTNTVYSTDCHKKNPIKAKGVFVIIGEKTIDQS